MSDLAASAVSVATDLANRLRVTELSGLDANCGSAMLFDELDRVDPDGGWALAAKDKLSAATREIEHTGNRKLCLYHGFSTLGFTAWRLSRGGSRYGPVLAEVDRWVVDRAADHARTALTRTWRPVAVRAATRAGAVSSPTGSAA